MLSLVSHSENPGNVQSPASIYAENAFIESNIHPGLISKQIPDGWRHRTALAIDADLFGTDLPVGLDQSSVSCCQKS